MKPPKFEHIFVAVTPFLLCKYYLYQLVHAISVIPPLLTTITQGGFTLKNKINKRGITATCFSKPHTNLGVRRSRRLGIITVTN